jgi:hypothetical protein
MYLVKKTKIGDIIILAKQIIRGKKTGQLIFPDSTSGKYIYSS